MSSTCRLDSLGDRPPQDAKGNGRPRAGGSGSVDGSMPLADFYAAQGEPGVPWHVRRLTRHAIEQLQLELRRTPIVADLLGNQVAQLELSLCGAGRSPRNAGQICERLYELRCLAERAGVTPVADRLTTSGVDGHAVSVSIPIGHRKSTSPLSPASPPRPNSTTPLRSFFDNHFSWTRKGNHARKYELAIRWATRLRLHRLEDLTTAKLEQALDELIDEHGKSDAFAERLMRCLGTMSREALKCGAIEAAASVPSLSPTSQQVPPWSTRELNALCGSARTMTGNTIAGLPPRLWWNGFVLALLDTGCTHRELLAARRPAYDQSVGTLAAGLLVYRLHPETLNALDGVRFGDGDDDDDDDRKLFPWPLTEEMLHQHYRQLLFRAGLPHVRQNGFGRLRSTSHIEDVMERLNVHLPFRPREGRPRIYRKRERRLWERSEEETRAARSRRPKPSTALCPLDQAPERSLRRFFEESYLPRKLAEAPAKSAGDHRTVIGRLCEFCEREVTLDDLSDDLVERFMLWARADGLSISTVNKYRALIVAIWQLAWRKRKVTEPPRDIDKLRTLKRLPNAWSQDELAKIIGESLKSRGSIGGISARLFWPAWLLLTYDTGLRLNATLNLRTSDLDLQTRWLTVPADFQKQKAEQKFRLHPTTMTCIGWTRPQERELLFPMAYVDASRLRERYREILIRAGLPHGPRDLFHKLRRTSGTFVCEALDETAASKHLGHSSLQVTKFYIDVSKLSRPQAVDVMQRPALPNFEEGNGQHV